MEPSLPHSLVRRLPRIRESLEGPRNLIIIDARRDPPRALVAYFRAWLEDGVRLAALADHDWRDVDSLVGEDTKLLIVLARGADLAEPVWDVMDRLQVRAYAVIGIDPENDETKRFIEPLPDYVDDWYARAARTSLEITGATSQIITRAILPMKFAISSHGADAFSAQFAIAGQGSDFPAGQPSWFRLDPGFEGILSIDRDPGLSGDAWRLEIGGANGGTVAALNRTIPYLPDAEAGPLDLLAVVLDRTCPDNANWSRAFDFVHGLTGDNFLREDQGPPLEQYNAEIRNGLTEGLKAAFAARLVRRVQTWWFKDVASNEMSKFVPMNLLSPEVGQARPAQAAEECKELFSVATYSPGLDLWDPAEKALQEAVEALDRSGCTSRAILIVGNSPPTDPTQPDSPLAALRTPPGARVACTTRRQSPLWQLALARCTELRIPLIYLFLRHTQFGSVHHHVVETYEHSQDRVTNTLAKTVALESEIAEGDIIRDATVRLVRALRAQAGLPSGVTLRALSR